MCDGQTSVTDQVMLNQYNVCVCVFVCVCVCVHVYVYVPVHRHICFYINHYFTIYGNYNSDLISDSKICVFGPLWNSSSL